MQRLLMLLVVILGLSLWIFPSKSYSQNAQMPNTWDKPIRWILEGDKLASERLMGKAKNQLFTLKNIQGEGSPQSMLNRKFRDGSSIFARTDVPMDIVRIYTPIIEVGGQITEQYEKEFFLVGGTNSLANLTAFEKWPLSLSSHTSDTKTGYETDSIGKMAVWQKKAEAWLGGGYDAVHCFDIKTGNYKESIDIKPPDTWEQIYCVGIDESEGLLFAGTDYSPTPYPNQGGAVYVIDLNTRTIINTFYLPSGHKYAQNFSIFNDTYNDVLYHRLYISCTTTYIDYYEIPSLSYIDSINASYGMQIGSSSENHKKGYIYYALAAFVTENAARLDIKTDTLIYAQYPQHECYATAVNPVTNNVYCAAVQDAGLGAKPAVVEFCEDLTPLRASEGFSVQYPSAAAGIEVQKNGKYVFAAFRVNSSTLGTIAKIKTEDLSIVKTVISDNYSYYSTGIYYKEDPEITIETEG